MTLRYAPQARLGQQILATLFIFTSVVAAIHGQSSGATRTGLPTGEDRIHYSKLSRINRDKVKNLKVAWMTAIDLNKGKIIWQIPFGEYPELAANGVTNSSSENYGGGKSKDPSGGNYGAFAL